LTYAILLSSPLQVAQERGDVSPVETRSASKKKQRRDRLPPLGAVLSFSPPDQEANARREQQELERRERVRAQRIQQAKADGRVFFTNGEEQYSSDLSPLDKASVIVETRVERVEVPVVNPENEKKLDSIEAAVQQLIAANSTREQMETNILQIQSEKLALEAKLMRNDQISSNYSKLEEENKKLFAEYRDMETKLSSVKEQSLVEKTRLEGELEASKREYSAKMEAVQESRKQMEVQLMDAQNDKSALMAKITELEQKLNSSCKELGEMKVSLESMRAQSDAETAKMSNKGDQLAEMNDRLKKEVDQLKTTMNQLENKVADYESELDEFENTLLPESEAQLQKALDELHLQKKAVSQLEAKIDAAIKRKEQVEEELETLKLEKEEERTQFQNLNEESSKAFERMTTDAATHAQKTEELVVALKHVESLLAKEKTQRLQSAKNLERLEEEMKENNEDFQNALSDLTAKLQKSETERKSLKAKLEIEIDKVKALSNAKEEVESEWSSTTVTLKSLEKSLVVEKERNNELEDARVSQQRRIQQLEEKLRATESQRDDAQCRMETFDTREEELFRKLRESDRIRRDLHNRVMQLSGNIRVYVRVRPALPGEAEKQMAAKQEKGDRKRKHEQLQEEESPFHFPGAFDRDASSKSETTSSSSADDLTKNLLEVTEPIKDRGGLSDRRKKWKFGFDHVFSPKQGQVDIWEATEPLVQSAIDGYNVCIFAYGQTGSGKTYTMLGEPSNEGLIERSVTKLFNAKSEMEALSRGSTQVKLSVELLEIYNEEVRDLLAATSKTSSRESLKVTSKEVVGNILVSTSSKEEVMEVLELAQSRRCVRATKSNAESSRSHMLFTIHFEVETVGGVSRKGKLHICDLAGSERLDKSGATGGGLTETKHINKSLSALSNVIERLQNGDSNIPYRDSKLTFLLQNSLGGNSKTLAIVCCNPLMDHFNESLCSLRFAAKVNKVDLKAVANFSC
jgi:kinesin family member C1